MASGNEDGNSLQAKLGELDVETLQQLLQTILANKTKTLNSEQKITTPVVPNNTPIDAPSVTADVNIENEEIDTTMDKNDQESNTPGDSQTGIEEAAPLLLNNCEELINKPVDNLQDVKTQDKAQNATSSSQAEDLVSEVLHLEQNAHAGEASVSENSPNQQNISVSFSSSTSLEQKLNEDEHNQPSPPNLPENFPVSAQDHESFGHPASDIESSLGLDLSHVINTAVMGNLSSDSSQTVELNSVLPPSDSEVISVNQEVQGEHLVNSIIPPDDSKILSDNLADSSLVQNLQQSFSMGDLDGSFSCEEECSINFPSAVPPVFISSSKIEDYLPKGVRVASEEVLIPLPLKPSLFIKDQKAAIVFEVDEAKFQELGKKLNQEEISNEKQAKKDQITIDIDQQSVAAKLAGDLKDSEKETLLHERRPVLTDEKPAVQVPNDSCVRAEDNLPSLRELEDNQDSRPTLQAASHDSRSNHDRSSFSSQSHSSVPQSLSVEPSEQHRLSRSSSLPLNPQLQQVVHSGAPSLSQPMRLPGLAPPVWMSDEECKNCCHCGRLFSVTRRKHHCRGCGKIFCNECCQQLAQLPYLNLKIARICVTCTVAIRKAHSDRKKLKREQQKTRRPSQNPMVAPPTTSSSSSLRYIPNEDVVRPNPESFRSGPNFMVPHDVSEGYQNGTGTTDNFNPSTNFVPSASDAPSNQSLVHDGPTSSVHLRSAGEPSRLRSWKTPSRPAGRTITWTGEANVGADEQKKRFKNLHKVLKNPEGAIIQVATKLSISACKIQVVVRQEKHEAWLLCSCGFAGCGQKEVAFLLEKRIEEDVFPYEMLKVFRTLYSMILNQGERFKHGNYLAFQNALLGSEDNAGFLFISSNKAPKLVQKYTMGRSLLYGVLLKESELPWAKYLPTRLLVALGVQQQCYPSPALSSRDRPSVCNIERNELFYSTFFAFNHFLNYKTAQALIPGVHILKSGSRAVLEMPFAYQTEIIGVLDSLLVDDGKPVTVPIAGDLVPEASGHFVFSNGNRSSSGRGFAVLQNSDEQMEPGNQYLALSSVLLVLTFGDECNSRTRFGVEVVEDGLRVTLGGSQAKEIRQAIYQGTNCAMSIGNTADSYDEFSLRWTSDTSPSILDPPKTIRVVQQQKEPRSYYSTLSATSLPPRRPETAGQTNVVIDRVKTREIEAAIEEKIVSDDPHGVVNKLENDVRQSCVACLLTFANRLRPLAEKRLNLALSLGPGYKKWSLGPNNQPINLARALQLTLNEISVPDASDEIVFVFNVTLQKRN